jgi:NDP-sugar pyrophosphorylase family protein
MVLAAGLGTRMRPLTLLRAKPVLPVMNRPLLHWTLELLARAGVRDVMVNLHHLPETVREAVGTGREFGLRIAYSMEPRILGTGGGPRKVRDFFGQEPFILVNGDMVFDFDLGAMMARHRAAGARATLALKPNPDPRRYPAIRTDRRGRVTSLRGLPRPTRGTASLFTGIHVLDPRILDRLRPGPSDTIEDLYAPLVADGETLLGMRMRGHWFDIGSPALYLASHRALLARGFGGAEGGRCIHPQAEVAHGASVKRSAVGRGSRVAEGARIGGSVLWDDVVVGEGARVIDSVLAAGTRVPAGAVYRNAVAILRGKRQQVTRVTA